MNTSRPPRLLRLFLSFAGVAYAMSLAGCGIELGPRGPYPAVTITELRTKLVFDGKPITVDGIVKCMRGSNHDSHGELRGFLDSGGPIYKCTPEWFGKRLPDGGALLVGAYAVRDRWGTGPETYRPDMAKHREIVAKVPRAVIWLDNAESPTKGEYYYSSIALDDPRSRLTKIESEIVGVYEDALPDKEASDPAEQVPWIAGKRPPKFLVGEYANVLPKELWSKIPGLMEVFRKIDEPTFQAFDAEITENQTRALGRLGLPFPEAIHPYQWPPPGTFVFLLGSGSNSSENYRNSTTRVQTKTSAGRLRLRRDLPRGVMNLTPENEFTLYRVNHIEIEADTVNVSPASKIHSYFFDPKDGSIYYFLNLRLRPGPDGQIYSGL